MEDRSPRKLIIPMGTLNPDENNIVEIPPEARDSKVLVAKRSEPHAWDSNYYPPRTGPAKKPIRLRSEGIRRQGLPPLSPLGEESNNYQSSFGEYGDMMRDRSYELPERSFAPHPPYTAPGRLSPSRPGPSGQRGGPCSQIGLFARDAPRVIPEKPLRRQPPCPQQFAPRVPPVKPQRRHPPSPAESPAHQSPPSKPPRRHPPSPAGQRLTSVAPPKPPRRHPPGSRPPITPPRDMENELEEREQRNLKDDLKRFQKARRKLFFNVVSLQMSKMKKVAKKIKARM